MKSENIRDIIKYIREREGMTHYALAQILNTTPTRVRSWEAGKSNPGINVIDEILYEFGYNVIVEKD